MEVIGLIIFLILWGLVIVRQVLILLGHYGYEIPKFSSDSMFRGTWLLRPKDDGRSRSLAADIIILAAYVLVEVVIIVFLVLQ
jgi:hypothetical protein